MQYLSDSPGSLSHESRCGALHLSSLSTYGKRAKADETVWELVTGWKRMRSYLFLESVTLVTVLQALVPRKQKKAFGAFTEAPDSKTPSRNPQSTIIYIQLAHRNNLFSLAERSSAIFSQKLHLGGPFCSATLAIEPIIWLCWHQNKSSYHNHCYNKWHNRVSIE